MNLATAASICARLSVASWGCCAAVTVGASITKPRSKTLRRALLIKETIRKKETPIRKLSRGATLTCRFRRGRTRDIGFNLCERIERLQFKRYAATNPCRLTYRLVLEPGSL